MYFYDYYYDTMCTIMDKVIINIIILCVVRAKGSRRSSSILRKLLRLPVAMVYMLGETE